MIALGATLVADDLCLLRRSGAALTVERPAGRPPLIELRGLGLVAVESAGRTPLAALLMLGPSAARMPDPEPVTILGVKVRLLRHPYRFDLAAKAMAWLRRCEQDDHNFAEDPPPPFT